tara:strand:+ start:138 stop:281 length:144 start_codon:yes stop_codon:yes gene_type:complete
MDYTKCDKIELMTMKITYLEMQLHIMKKIDFLDLQIKKKEKDEKNEQ